jgi:hypothetical protein
MKVIVLGGGLFHGFSTIPGTPLPPEVPQTSIQEPLPANVQDQHAHFDGA